MKRFYFTFVKHGHVKAALTFLLGYCVLSLLLVDIPLVQQGRTTWSGQQAQVGAGNATEHSQEGAEHHNGSVPLSWQRFFWGLKFIIYLLFPSLKYSLTVIQKWTSITGFCSLRSFILCTDNYIWKTLEGKWSKERRKWQILDTLYKCKLDLCYLGKADFKKLLLFFFTKALVNQKNRNICMILQI